MASTQLRLRGVKPLQLAVAAASLAPLGYVGYLAVGKGVALSQLMMGLCGAIALLPWLSRAVARAGYRASLDDIAVHVRGEAMPYRAIARIVVHRSWRRTLLEIERSETVDMWLLLDDAFAGRLEPLDALIEKLEKHNVDVSALKALRSA